MTMEERLNRAQVLERFVKVVVTNKAEIAKVDGEEWAFMLTYVGNTPNSVMAGCPRTVNEEADYLMNLDG